MNETSDDALVRTIHIEAPPETVFRYLVEPAKMVAWMGLSATFEARPGGAYRVAITQGDIARGEVLAIEPGRRVVYSWGWEGGELLPPGASRIEITLVARGGGTDLKLVHSGFPTADLVSRHGEGWDHYLARLATAAAGGDAGPDPWLDENAAE